MEAVTDNWLEEIKNIYGNFDEVREGETPEEAEERKRLIIESELENQREYEERQKQKEEDEKNKYYDSVIDKKYRDSEFSDFIVNDQNQKQIEKLKNWIDDFKLPNWLVISGEQGTGKTMLKNILIKELYKKGFKCDSYDYQVMSIEYQDRISNGSLMKYFNHLIYDKIMIIDELGRKKATEGFFDFMFSVINQMYLENKTVILITNLPISNEGIGKFIDMDRLKENAKSIVLTGDSFRGKK